MRDYTPSLHRLARLAREQPTLLAGFLSSYQEQEGLDDRGLAMFLECTVEMLPRLALCRRPRSAPHFRADVEHIATYVHANAIQLARLVRAVQARRGRHQALGTTSQMLLAARDRDDEKQSKTASDESDDDQ